VKWKKSHDLDLDKYADEDGGNAYDTGSWEAKDGAE
jgi:hypothetical protein